MTFYYFYIISIITTLSLFIFFSLFINHGKIIKINNVLEKYSFIFCIIISLILGIEYWVFGNSSYVRVYDEIDSIFPLKFLISTSPEYNYLHSVAGGMLKEAVSFTTKRIDLQVIILQYFGGFYSYLFIKILNIFIAIYGGYLLFSKNQCSPLISLLFALNIFLSSIIITSYGFAHGIGYASIPLTIYLLFFFENKYKILILFIYTFLLGVFISFPHSFLSHSAAILSFSTYYLFKNNYKTLIQSIGFLILFSLICIFNNFENIEYIYKLKNELTRGALKGIFSIGYFNFLNFISSKFLFGYLLLIVCILLSIYLIFKKKFLLQLLLIFNPLIYLFLKISFNFEYFKFFEGIRLELIFFSLPTILFFIINKIFIFKNFSYLKFNIIFFIFLNFLVLNKMYVLSEWLGKSGGSFNSNLEISQNFKFFLSKQGIFSEDLQYETNYRSVIIPSEITPGFFIYNNISSLDGYANFFYYDRAKDWLAASKDRNTYGSIAGGELYITERNKIYSKDIINIANYFDIDFLRNKSVRYIFSKYRISDKELTLLYEPDHLINKSFLNKVYKNFSKVDLYLYEIKNYKKIITLIINNKILNNKNIIREKKGWKIILDNTKQINVIKMNLNLPNIKNIIIKNNNFNKKFFDKNGNFYIDLNDYINKIGNEILIEVII